MLSDEHAQTILTLARDAIRHGLEFGRPLDLDPCSGLLAEPGACFVSLHIGEELRGCIGQTERTRPLAEQLVDNAFAAAFRDPRFPPLRRHELSELSIEVHILGPLEALSFANLAALYALLRPGEDGLQLDDGARRGVFLPVMWKELPTPRRFVEQLLRKAGIAESAPLSASRFQAQVLAEVANRA